LCRISEIIESSRKGVFPTFVSLENKDNDREIQDIDNWQSMTNPRLPARRQAFAAQVESRCQTYLAYVQFLKASGQME